MKNYVKHAMKTKKNLLTVHCNLQYFTYAVMYNQDGKNSHVGHDSWYYTCTCTRVVWSYCS